MAYWSQLSLIIVWLCCSWEKQKQNYRTKSTKAIKNDEDALARFLVCLVRIILAELVHLCEMTNKLFLFGYISELALTFT